MKLKYLTLSDSQTAHMYTDRILLNHKTIVFHRSDIEIYVNIYSIKKYV